MGRAPRPSRAQVLWRLLVWFPLLSTDGWALRPQVWTHLSTHWEQASPVSHPYLSVNFCCRYLYLRTWWGEITYTEIKLLFWKKKFTDGHHNREKSCLCHILVFLAVYWTYLFHRRDQYSLGRSHIRNHSQHQHMFLHLNKDSQCNHLYYYRN